MSDSETGKRTQQRRVSLVRRCLLLSVLVCMTAGCRFNVAMLRMILGDPSVQSSFQTQTDVDLTEGNHRLLILCSALHSVTSDNPSLPIDVVTEVSTRLRSKGIEIVDPDDVSTWLDDHGSWDDLGALGTEFKTDFIAVIHLQQLTFKEPHSTNLLRAHAVGEVRVFELVKGDDAPYAAERFRIPINDRYPSSNPINANESSEELFRKKAVDDLCRDFARIFHDYHRGEAIN